MQGFLTQIRCFKLTALEPLMSGAVVQDVFPKSEAMPALEVLSVLSDRGDFRICRLARTRLERIA